MKELTKHIIKFGVLATTGIGLGMMLSKKKGDEEINTVESEDNKGEDSYNPGWSKNRILSNKRFNSRYENDLKRWGTKQGVIDVSNDEGAEKKKHKLASQMGRVGNELVKDHLAELLVKTRPKKSLTPLQDYYTWLQKEYSITQVTIRNTSATERLIRLWGANKGGAISPTLPSDVEDHTIIRQVTVPVSTGMAIHPIEAAHNPANGYTYVTNQLSNNVTVLNDQGDIVRLIQLEPNALPGSNSPVGIAINTKPSSPNYGRAYVAGSVANTLSIIDLSFNVVDEIAVGNRPIGVAYNPYNDRLYVTNHVDDSLSVIQADTEILLFTAPTGNNPRGVGVSAANGTTYVANQGGDDVWIYDIASQFAISIAVGNSPTYVTHHPPSGEMLVVNSGSNDITPIDPILYQPLPSFGVGNNPSNLAFNPANNFMYVGNRADNTFTILSPDKSIRATLNLGNVNVGFAFNATGEVLFVADTGTNTVNVIGFLDDSSSIIIDDDFQKQIRTFQHNPAIVKHSKFVFSTPEQFQVLTLQEEQATGKVKSTPISFTNYKNPQTILNVSEVSGFEGSLIDGHNSWLFKIAGNQTITILVYYKQFEMYSLIKSM